MKKNTIISTLIILIGSFLSAYFGPWWAPAVFIILVSALLNLSPKQAVLSGTILLGFIYLFMSVWMATQDEANILEKTGALMGGLSTVILIVLTTLIGCLTGLLSGWLGSALGGIFRKKEMSNT